MHMRTSSPESTQYYIPKRESQRNICNNCVVSGYVISCLPGIVPTRNSYHLWMYFGYIYLISKVNNKLATLLSAKSFKYIFTSIPSLTQRKIDCFLKRGVLFGIYYPYNLVFRALCISILRGAAKAAAALRGPALETCLSQIGQADGAAVHAD